MRSKNCFSSEERTSIGIAKDKLTEIYSLKRYIERLQAAKKQVWLRLSNTGYRAPRLTQFINDRQSYSDGILSWNICKLLDESKRIDEEFTIAKERFNMIIYAINGMPTEKFREILIKKYVVGGKTTQRDRDFRYNYLNNAYLEFFLVYFE